MVSNGKPTNLSTEAFKDIICVFEEDEAQAVENKDIRQILKSAKVEIAKKEWQLNLTYCFSNTAFMWQLHGAASKNIYQQIYHHKSVAKEWSTICYIEEYHKYF